MSILRIKKYFQRTLLWVGWLLLIAFQPAWAADAQTNYQTRFEQAEKLAQTGTEQNVGQAVVLWKALLNDFPNDLAISNNLAATLMQQKKYSEAQQYLESALNADPKIAVVMSNLNDIYAYQAQLAYQSVFKPSEINHPKGKWVGLAGGNMQSTETAQLDKAKKDMQKVLNRVENWRVSWASKDIKSYLSFYQTGFLPNEFPKHEDWVKNRENSLKRPKYIKIILKDIKVVPLANRTIQVSFEQFYESNRFKDQVKKYLVWQDDGKNWKIIQEKSVYD